MRNCWELAPENRNTFAEICLLLTQILEAANSNYGYVDVVQLNEAEMLELEDNESAAWFFKARVPDHYFCEFF